MEPSRLGAIRQFFRGTDYAVVGVSRRPRGFGWIALNELKRRGYSVFAVNRHPGTYNQTEYYSSISSIPRQPKAAVVVTPPGESRRLVPELIRQGVNQIWLQPGAESEEVVKLCLDQGVNVVHGWCILMFAEPVRSIHRLHRGLLGLAGRLPRG